MKEYRKIVHAPGEITKFESVFEENPYLRTGVPSRMGKVERLDYTTGVYENGITYKKTAYVYLPYCYDAEDKSRRYNVMYFQHGNTCEPAMFAVGGNKYMFDMLFDDDTLDPCIIVFITYYMDPMRNAEKRTMTGEGESGDGWTPGIPANYFEEILRDIIPAVELKYNTFLEDGSKESIKASRDHRAFSGYSRGTTWTWRMWHYDLEYFRWFCPFSGSICCDVPLPTPPEAAPFPTFTEKEIIDYFRYPIDRNPELPFFIYVTSGGPTDGGPILRDQVKMLSEQDGISYGTDPVKNNFYYSVSDYYHTDHLVPYYLWNALKVVFTGI